MLGFHKAVIGENSGSVEGQWPVRPDVDHYTVLSAVARALSGLETRARH